MTTTRTNEQLTAVLDTARELYADPQFTQDTHQQMGFEHAIMGRPEPRNWQAYLWAAAYSHARYEHSDEGGRAIAQAEADSAWFGHDGSTPQGYRFGYAN